MMLWALEVRRRGQWILWAVANTKKRLVNEFPLEVYVAEAYKACGLDASWRVVVI